MCFFLLLQILLNQYTKDIIKNNIWRETIFAVFFFSRLFGQRHFVPAGDISLFSNIKIHTGLLSFIVIKRIFSFMFLLPSKGNGAVQCSFIYFFVLFFCFLFFCNTRFVWCSSRGMDVPWYDFCYYRSG